LAGARLLEAVPLAPLVAGVRLSVTARSYDGQFAVSLLADDSMPDLPVLAAGVRGAFDSYVNAVGKINKSLTMRQPGKSPSSSCGAVISMPRIRVSIASSTRPSADRKTPRRDPLSGHVSQLRHVPRSGHSCPDTVDLETVTLHNDPLRVAMTRQPRRTLRGAGGGAGSRPSGLS
jgi:hypothetical protein